METVSKMCRVCLKKAGSISIFDTNEDSEYYAKINRLTKKEIIKKNDGLPAFICFQCESELAISYNFVRKCEKSDKLLRCANVQDILPTQDSDDFFIAIKKEEDLFLEAHPADDLLASDDDFKCDVSDFKCESEDEPLIRKKRKYTKRKVREKILVDKPKIPCEQCGLLVSSKAAMILHLRRHTGERPYHCDRCHKKYSTRGSLKKHYETRHTERERLYTCETCGNSFYRKRDIVIHMRRHTGEKPHICPFCSRKFLQIGSLIRHKRTHTGEKPFKCPICPKAFADSTMLKRHSSTHNDIRNYPCTLCTKAFKTTTAHHAHMKLHSNEKMHVCNYCGMAFAAKGNLKLHMLRVHSEKSGHCDKCNKTFSNLEGHMRKHTGECPFVCTDCGRAFTSQRSLTNHVQSKHANLDKYVCKIETCTKSFPKPSMLEFHQLKDHNHHTPFICSQCGRGFYRMSDLSRHLRVSHGVAQFVKKEMKPILRQDL